MAGWNATDSPLITSPAPDNVDRSQRPSITEPSASLVTHLHLDTNTNQSE